MSAIIIESKRPESGPVITATAIGPFDTFRDADKFAVELCRERSDCIYSVLLLIEPEGI